MGVALAGMILASSKGTDAPFRQDMTRMESRLEAQINDLREAITARAAAS